MANSRMVKAILETVAAGEIERYKVSKKIKNYPKEDQKEAINYVLKNSYVSLRQSKPVTRGRAAVFISITDAGLKALDVLIAEDDADTVWKVCV